MIQVHGETSWKIWAFVGGIGCVLVYLATFSAGRLVQKDALTPESVSYSYEMPRGESMEAPFDLSNRSVDRKTIGGAVTQEPSQPAAVVNVAEKKESKAVSKNAKKPPLSPAQALAAKKKAQAALQAKAKTQARKKQFVMQVLQDRQRAQFKKDVDGSSASETAVSFGGVMGQAANAEPVSDEPKKEEDPDLSLSASQWRALLQTDPSSANVARLVKVLGKNKLDSAAFYQIAKELLLDSAPDRRKAGLLLLSATPSVASYEFMVTQQVEMNPELQLEVKKEIARYSQPAMLPVTSRIIGTSKEPAVITSAMGNLALAIENYKKQPAAGTISSQGGSKEPRIAVSSFNQFLTGLATVSQSEDPALAELAKNLVKSIEEVKK